MEDPWLTTREVAARYHVSEGCVRWWRHVGRGPKGTLFGRRVLYRESDVAAWERECEAADPIRRAAS